MKKRKILSLVLAVLMLAGIATLFASCGDKNSSGAISPSKNTVDVNISGYELVYGDALGDGYTNIFRTQMDLLAAKMNDITGGKVKANTMKRANKDVNTKEILVGKTERQESLDAYSEIKGDGFLIKVTDNKIVLAGTSDVFVLMAITYFIENYMKNVNGTTLTIHESVGANEMETVVLTDSVYKEMSATEAGVYSYVYSDALGRRPSAYINVTTVASKSTYSEYEQVATENICTKMKGISGLGGKYFPVITDKDTSTKEILIGRVNRAESAALLNSLDVEEFGIAVMGDKIAINAWSESTLRLAANAYIDLMAEATVETEGGKQVRLPKDFRLVGNTANEWVVDFPKPEGEGISLYNTMDANDNALQYLYTGSGVNEAAYNAYCAKLKAEGYTIYQETSSEGSHFKTFVNKNKDVALYVAYNAYAHKDEFGNYDWTVSKKIDTQVVDVYKYDPCIRIVSSTIDDAQLPEQSILKKQSYTWVTNSKITAMPIYSKAVGLSYVVTLEDGSFVVFDGGGVNDNGGTEHVILWNTLLALYREINGDDATPNSNNPIRIAAWVLTHAHWDHYYAFQQLAKKYGSTGQLQVDYMIANIPAVGSVYTMDEIAVCMTPEGVESLKNSIKGGFKYIKVHTGQKFYLANLEIEVLTTWEDLNPIVSNTSNDTNSVFRFTLTSKKAPSADPITQIWTGDANRWQSRFMCATYGPALKADMVSVAHHGNAGCEVDFYEMVSPEVIWWPHNASAAKSYLAPSNKTSGWQYEVDQHFTNNIASVKYIYTSGAVDGKAGDLSYFTTLELVPNGSTYTPDYEGVYDLLTKEQLLYTDISNGAFDAAGNSHVSHCMKK